MDQLKLRIVRLLDEYLNEAKELGLVDPNTRAIEEFRNAFVEGRDDRTLELPL